MNRPIASVEPALRRSQQMTIPAPNPIPPDAPAIRPGNKPIAPGEPSPSPTIPTLPMIDPQPPQPPAIVGDDEDSLEAESP